MGCDGSHNEDKTVPVSVEDAQMNDAISKAKASLSSFIEILKSPKPGQKYFLVKGRFVSGEEVEHIWVADISFDGRSFQGVIANEPKSIKDLKFKQPITVNSSDVSDWMYVQNGKLVGGFTSRLLRDRKTDEQRREEDLQLPYRY